jgi:hypothetical protein
MPADYRNNIVVTAWVYWPFKKSRSKAAIAASATTTVRNIVPLNYFERPVVQPYFNWPDTELNVVFSLAAKPFTTAMMATEIPAAIRPYSMVVAAVSSLKNARTTASRGLRVTGIP